MAEKVEVTGEFQSTSPVRGTTSGQILLYFSSFISIHVPREGDDGGESHIARTVNDFNPRPP